MVNSTPKKKITKSYSLQKTVADELKRFAISCEESESSALDFILVEFLNAMGKIEEMSDAKDFNKAAKTNENVFYTSNTGTEFLVTMHLTFVASAEE